MTKPNSLLSSLDTSGFALIDDAEYENSDVDDYDASYFDIEKATSSNSNKRAQKNGVSSVNFETDVFDLGPISGEYDGAEEDYGGASSSSSSSSFSSLSSSSLPSHSSTKTSLSSMARRPSNSKIPIRNVLDIFQELKLSFGRVPQR